MVSSIHGPLIDKQRASELPTLSWFHRPREESQAQPITSFHVALQHTLSLSPSTHIISLSHTHHQHHFLSQINSVSIKPTNFKLYLSFYCSHIGFSSKYKPFTSEANWKGRNGVAWGRSNFSAQKCPEEGKSRSYLHWSLQHFLLLWNIYDSAVLHCLLPFPTCNLYRQKHMDTHVNPRRELLALIHYLYHVLVIKLNICRRPCSF